jgi:hypothetical protein
MVKSLTFKTIKPMKNLIESIASIVIVFVLVAIAIVLINATISGMLAILSSSNFTSIMGSAAMLSLSVLAYIMGLIMSLIYFAQNNK